MNYEDWNLQLAARTFNTENEGKRVFLSVTPDLLDSLAGGNGYTDFLTAVRAGPANSGNATFCTKALRICKSWRENGAQGFPPYLAMLGTFVLASALEDEHGFGGYYKKLRELLGIQINDKAPHNFDDCLELWDDLETWACKDKAGSLGEFRVDFFGGHIYVAVPAAQTLLTENERVLLPELFRKAHIDPNVDISEAEFARLLVQHGYGILHRRTLRRLGKETEASAEFRSVLIEQLQEELERYGETHLSVDPTSKAPLPRSVRLFLSIKPNEIVQGLQTSLCFDSRAFDSLGTITISGQNTGVAAHVSMTGSRWCFPSVGDFSLSGQQVDWERGETFTTAPELFRFNFPPSKIRIFESGIKYEAPDLLERAKLSHETPFWLALTGDLTDIVAWGESNCVGWHEVTVRKGLPEKWRLFHADRVLSTRDIEDKYPCLALSRTLKIRLVGGLRVGKGNRFLDSAPPSVTVEGITEAYKLTCNGTEVPCENRVHGIQREQLKEYNEIELTESSGNRHRRYFTAVFVDKICWKTGWEFGRANEDFCIDAHTTISGCKVEGNEASGYPRSRDLPEGAIIIGSRPGDIVRADELNGEKWDPVWILMPGKKVRRLLFCGKSVAGARPHLATSVNRKGMRLWKKMLHFERRKICVPNHPELACLWQAYLKTARDV